jgi:Xaa-Pro aminopeptidase
MTTKIGHISTQEYEHRLFRVQEQMVEKGLHALVAFSSYQEREGHVAYLTNHRNSLPNGMSHQGIGHAAVLVPLQGKTILVAPGGYEAEKVISICDVLTGEALIPETVRALRMLNLSAGKIGIAGVDVVPAEYFLQLHKDVPKATFGKADDILENQRLIKSPTEIELLQKAAKIGDRVIKTGLEAIQPGVNGWQIELRIRAAAAEAGADFIPRIRVCSGKTINPLIWPQVDRREFEEGDFVLLEVAGWYAGYGFECSRVVVAGEPTHEQKDYLEHLAEATEWMIGTLKSDIKKTFYLNESRGREIHPVGHGIGLEICENPGIRIEKPIKLKAGMVLCIKPSIASHQFGRMAIEDMIAITGAGVKVLNQH